MVFRSSGCFAFVLKFQVSAYFPKARHPKDLKKSDHGRTFGSKPEARPEESKPEMSRSESLDGAQGCTTGRGALDGRPQKWG